jgi:hypothetical protein
MNPPTTFTRRGSHVVTILTAKDGEAMSQENKEYCALTLAHRSAKHSDAINSIIAHGLARNPAEADALIYAAEDGERK